MLRKHAAREDENTRNYEVERVLDITLIKCNSLSVDITLIRCKKWLNLHYRQHQPLLMSYCWASTLTSTRFYVPQLGTIIINLFLYPTTGHGSLLRMRRIKP